MDNINSAFAMARSHLRSLQSATINNTAGGQANEALQGMVDALDSLQDEGSSAFKPRVPAFNQ
jgi:hypothetical protein